MSEPRSGALRLPDVSRETLDRLRLLERLVLKWNRRINLIGRATEPDLWRRHVEDSMQLWTLHPPDLRLWLDLGSGAGFPGLVVAALAAAAAPSARVVLVESDQRKAVFLAEAAREIGLKLDLHTTRIESLDPLGADVVSARALAPLDRLLEHLAKHRAPGGIGLFPKGETVHKEIEDAAKRWRFEHRIHPSVTGPGAAVVEVGDLSRV